MATRTISEIIREFNDEGIMTRESITETTEEYDEISYVPTYYPYVVQKEEKLVPVKSETTFTPDLGASDAQTFQESIQKYFDSGTDSGFPLVFDPGFGEEFLTGNPKE